MTKQMEEEYKKSLKFWNDWLGKEEEIPDDFNQETSWKEIGCDALVEAAALVGGCEKVLDYGCGSGWASVIIAKNGCKYVKAVDVSPNGVKSAEKYAKLFHMENDISFEAISKDWIIEEKEEQFDGFFCSNVLDVVPRTVSEQIIKGAYRVCKRGAKLVIGMNPYFDKEMRETRSMVEKEPNHLFTDDILRIVNYTDDEWMEMFRPYFKIKECRHFRWDGEPDTINRRIFILEK